jgi:hypothetical protein
MVDVAGDGSTSRIDAITSREKQQTRKPTTISTTSTIKQQRQGLSCGGCADLVVDGRSSAVASSGAPPSTAAG